MRKKSELNEILKNKYEIVQNKNAKRYKRVSTRCET